MQQVIQRGLAIQDVDDAVGDVVILKTADDDFGVRRVIFNE